MCHWLNCPPQLCLHDAIFSGLPPCRPMSKLRTSSLVCSTYKKKTKSDEYREYRLEDAKLGLLSKYSLDHWKFSWHQDIMHACRSKRCGSTICSCDPSTDILLGVVWLHWALWWKLPTLHRHTRERHIILACPARRQSFVLGALFEVCFFFKRTSRSGWCPARYATVEAQLLIRKECQSNLFPGKFSPSTCTTSNLHAVQGCPLGLHPVGKVAGNEGQKRP